MCAARRRGPGGGGGGGTETLHSAHVHNDAPAMSSMSANTKGKIAVTSNARLALSAAVLVEILILYVVCTSSI